MVFMAIQILSMIYSIIVWPIDMENALKIWEVFEHIEGLKDNFPTVIA
jgi:hypothetical protein